jgi:hypothetical protein
MLKLKVDKAQYDALSDDLKAEYKEDGDSYVIQVDGMKTQTDIDNVLEAKRKEKADRETAEARVKELESEVGSLGDKIKVYESDESKKLSAEERVELERLKRENETLSTEKTGLQEQFDGLNGKLTRNQILDALRKSAKGIIRDDAINDTIETLADKFVVSDGKVLTNSDLGDKSGLEAGAYLSDFTKDRSYLAPTSSGGGSGGSGGSGGGSQGNSTEGSIEEAIAEAWGQTK